MSRRQRASLLILSAIFVTAGVLHFVAPGTYTEIIPPWLPAPLLLVYLSGAAEIAGGAGLLLSRTRRAAGVGLIVLLLAVWPANIQMWSDARSGGADARETLVLLIRIPLQLVLIWWVWKAALQRSESRPTPDQHHTE